MVSVTRGRVVVTVMLPGIDPQTDLEDPCVVAGGGLGTPSKLVRFPTPLSPGRFISEVRAIVFAH